MLNESLFLLSFDELKEFLGHELNISHIAVGYVLTYVVYKALGRYVYFKTQEHASKINRTFLTLSLLVILLHELNGIASSLPFLGQYRWFYVLNTLVLLIAPFSVLTYRVIWKYKHGQRGGRDWHYYYLPISRDYYKTNVRKSERDGIYTHDWEEEQVESTSENIHSDIMLNLLALIVFICLSAKWTIESAVSFGSFSYAYGTVICLVIIGLFIDRTAFSWILYLEKNYKTLFKKK